MEKWKKLIFAAAAIFLVVLPGASHSQTCEPRCSPCGWSPERCWGFDIFADYLYWKPCVDDLDFAAQLTDLSDTPPDISYHQHIDYKSLCPDWEQGFRVGLAINDMWCEWRLSGSFTYLDASESSELFAEEGTVVVSPLQFAGLTNPNQDEEDNRGGFDIVEGKFDLTYHCWDVLLSRAICSSDCYVLAPFIGVEGLILDQKIETESRFFDQDDDEEEEINGDGFASTEWKSDFHAYGLKFGTDYTYQLADCLSFFTRGSFTIAVGENDGKNEQYLRLNSDGEEGRTVQRITAEEDDSCQFVNGYHIQVGFIYETDMCGCDLAVRVGYEFLKWHNVPQPRRFPGGDDNLENAYNRSISTSPSKSTIGFHGLLAGLSIGF